MSSDVEFIKLLNRYSSALGAAFAALQTYPSSIPFPFTGIKNKELLDALAMARRIPQDPNIRMDVVEEVTQKIQAHKREVTRARYTLIYVCSACEAKYTTLDVATNQLLRCTHCNHPIHTNDDIS